MRFKIELIQYHRSEVFYRITSILENNYHECPSCKKNTFYLADNKQKGICICAYDMSDFYVNKIYNNYYIKKG